MIDKCMNEGCDCNGDTSGQTINNNCYLYNTVNDCPKVKPKLISMEKMLKGNKPVICGKTTCDYFDLESTSNCELFNKLAIPSFCSHYETLNVEPELPPITELNIEQRIWYAADEYYISVIYSTGYISITPVNRGRTLSFMAYPDKGMSLTKPRQL